MDKIKYFSSFTGIGGLDMGLEEIGAECVGFSEIKKSSIEIYNKNYPDRKNYGDLTKIDPSSLPDFDLFIGGFPCQSFSLAGLRKGFGDKRGHMIFYIYDILIKKKPKFVVLENVKGLLNHDKGKTYENVLKLLVHAGYNVRVLLLNSLNYGSAQNRERLLFLCSKEQFDLKIPVIVDNKKVFRDIIDIDETNYKLIPNNDRNFAKVEQQRVFNFELIGGYDKVGTLTTQYGCGEKVVQYKEWFRYLTPLECERLQGFPDNWTKGVKNNNRYFALGNAVNCNVSKYLFKEYLKNVWW